jgi:hypothetical protein
MCAQMKSIRSCKIMRFGLPLLAALLIIRVAPAFADTYEWSLAAMRGTLTPSNFCTSDGVLINCSTATVNLASQVTGYLSVINGGTGANTASAAVSNLLSSPLAGTYQLSCDGSGCTPISVAESSGIVNSGVQYQMAYYAATGTSVSGNPYIYTSATNDFIVAAGKIGIGTTTLGNTLTVAGSFGLVFGSDYSTTGAQSDVAINGSSAIRYTGAGTATFQGIVAGGNGQVLYLHNASSYVLTLANQSSSEDTAANRIITGTGSDIPVPADTSVSLQYDAAAQRWRVTGSSNAAKALAAGATTQLQYNDAGDMAGAPGLIYDKTNARTGVGSATPVATLDVNGAVRVAGTGSETCSSTNTGLVRYNASLRRLEACHGRSTSSFSVAFTTTPIGTENQTAAAFQFTNAIVSDSYTYQITSSGGGGAVTGSGTISSSSQTVTGIDISSLGDGSLTLQASLTTPSMTSDGYALANVVKSTGGLGCSQVGDTCSDGSIYAGTDAYGVLYTTPCDLGMTGTHNNCTGTRSTYTWNDGSANWVEVGSSSQNSSYGMPNTIALFNKGTSTSPAPYLAARACVALGSGWYLPARYELNLLYLNRATIGGFSTSSYWSSYEWYSEGTYDQSFNTGAMAYVVKNLALYVRCVRR